MIENKHGVRTAHRPISLSRTDMRVEQNAEIIRETNLRAMTQLASDRAQPAVDEFGNNGEAVFPRREADFLFEVARAHHAAHARPA